MPERLDRYQNLMRDRFLKRLQETVAEQREADVADSLLYAMTPPIQGQIGELIAGDQIMLNGHQSTIISVDEAGGLTLEAIEQAAMLLDNAPVRHRWQETPPVADRRNPHNQIGALAVGELERRTPTINPIPQRPQGRISDDGEGSMRSRVRIQENISRSSREANRAYDRLIRESQAENPNYNRWMDIREPEDELYEFFSVIVKNDKPARWSKSMSTCDLDGHDHSRLPF